ncbi:internal scaffolding protein [Chifec microvirus UA13_24]|nr:internal scaffolding protein [Chifec microvirus UA13_24]
MTDFLTPYVQKTRLKKTFTKPTMAQQQFKDECDINSIIKRYKTTGYLTDPLKPPTRRPSFGDFTEVPSFHEAQTFIAEAYEEFMALPAALRKKFDNDPAALVSWLNDEANQEEAIALGLVEKPAPIQPSRPDETVKTETVEKVEE